MIDIDMSTMVWIRGLGLYGPLGPHGGESHFVAHIIYMACQARGWSNDHFERTAADKPGDVNYDPWCTSCLTPRDSFPRSHL